MTHPPSTITVDAFLGGALRLRQPVGGYRAGVDPVLLAATCAAGAGARVLDCGAGVGTVGLAIARRCVDVQVTLVERSPAYVALAAANIADNGLSARVELVEADLTAPLSRLDALAARVGTFDEAYANPPYYIDTDGTRATSGLKDAANAMPANALDAWLRFMAALLRPGGIVTVIHRADALPRLIDALDRRFGGVVVRPVHPRADTAANRVLVRATKASRAPLTLLPPLVLHDMSGGYTPSVAAVLKHGAALSLDRPS